VTRRTSLEDTGRERRTKDKKWTTNDFSNKELLTIALRGHLTQKSDALTNSKMGTHKKNLLLPWGWQRSSPAPSR